MKKQVKQWMDNNPFFVECVETIVILIISALTLYAVTWIGKFFL